MKSVYENISEMNTAFGNLKGLALSENGNISEYGTQRLIAQAQNLPDELRELERDAFAPLKEDPKSPKARKELFDAIADILVFLHGAGHFMDMEVSYRFNSDVYVLPEFYENEAKQIVKLRPGTPEFFDQFIEVVKTHMNFFITGIMLNEMWTIDDHYRKIDNDMHFLFNHYAKPGKTVELLIERVVESNMSKLCKNQEEVDATLKYYRDMGVEVDVKDSPLMQEEGVPFLVVYSTKDQIIIVDGKEKEFRADKFLKNINWKEPVLADF